MDIVKVRELSDLELGSELATQRRHLYDLRFQLATRQLTDHSQLTSARRTIARLLTVMTERGLDENEIVRKAAPPEARRTLRRGRAAGTKATPAARSTTRRTSTSTAKKEEAAAETASGGNEE
jgi:large subunit ribosomal protein L29